MRNRFEEYLPAALNMISGIGASVISFQGNGRFEAATEVAKRAGMALVVIGMAIVAWSAFHLRGAFLGEVAPTREDIVRSGPYASVRHPVYLGMTIALAGAAISLSSWLGLLAVFGLFLPSEIYRAKREEQSLLGKHGTEWEEYVKGTGFILPFL